MYTRKWKKGRALTVMEALEEIANRQPVYWNDKWTHPGWSASWQKHSGMEAFLRWQ